MTDQIKKCKICSIKFLFNEEEHLMANGEDFLEKGHPSALFPDVCQRCNMVLTTLDAVCTYHDDYKELLDGFDEFASSTAELTNFISYADRNF